MLDSCTCSDGIISDCLMVVGLEAGINFEGVTVKPMEDNQSCLDGNSFDSTAVDGLEVGTSSDGLVVVSTVTYCFFSIGFNSNGHESVGFNSDAFTLALGKTDKVNSQLSKGTFFGKYP